MASLISSTSYISECWFQSLSEIEGKDPRYTLIVVYNMGLPGQFQIFDLMSEFSRALGIFHEFRLTLGIRFEPVWTGFGWFVEA